MLQVPDDALAPMGLAAAQALAAGRKALAARKPPAAGDAATQQKTLSRLGLPRHTAFFEAEEAALEQVSSQQGSAVRFSAGGFVGFGEAAGSVTWVVEVSKDGIYRLVFLYASKAYAPVQLTLHVDNSPAHLRFETTADEMAVRAQAAKVQLSAGVHVVRLQAPRHHAEGFRLDALLLASDDAAATAKLGLKGVHGAPGGAPPAAGALNVQPTVGGGRLPGARAPKSTYYLWRAVTKRSAQRCWLQSGKAK